jgi:predicted TIM-barrel fold metal-dependent hydrolase
MMDDAGVDRAVLVPPSWEGDRNDYCAEAARAHPHRFAVAGRVPLDIPISAEALKDHCDQSALRGIRLTFARGAAQQWLRDGTADWLWPVAAEIDMPVFLYAPDLLDEVARIARAHPRLRIILDHLAIRTSLRNGEIDPVLDQLLKLADLGNVAVKATSLPSYVTEDYPFPSLHHRIRRVVEGFGPRRVFWGSDVTRLPVSYAAARRLFTEELDFLSTNDLEWIMGRALSEWIHWPGNDSGR